MNPLQRFNQSLEGQPDYVLSLIMFGLGVALIAGAVYAPASLKVAAIAWVALP